MHVERILTLHNCDAVVDKGDCVASVGEHDVG